MPRGPRVTKPVRDLVIRIFDILLQRTGDLPSGPTVHTQVGEELVKLGWPDPVPSLRAVQQILEGPRQRARAVADVDLPWTLAAFNSHADQVPDDAAGALLGVWAYAVVRSEPFTLRQAKWANRLRWVVRAGGGSDHSGHVQRPDSVYYWAARYAGRERLSELANQPMETADLDAVLGLNAEVHASAARIGIVPAVAPEASGQDLSETAPSFISWHLGVADVWSAETARFGERMLARLRLVPRSRRLAAAELFDLWFRWFGRVGTLNDMTVNEVFAVIEEIVEQVRAAAVDEHSGPWFEDTAMAPIFHWDQRESALQAWRPSHELLRRVGIPDDEHTKEG